MHTSISNQQFRGRKMRPGRAVATHESGVMYFVCYCDNCNAKIVADRDYLGKLIKTSQKSSRGVRVRIIKLLMATLRVEEQ